ncbi:MAG TPA: choice-of-anchor D domain-containing protein, partial [Phototrophicaceae bacterium]|nr:choice-of-anchor D domain-containing protein [Phototrophicaceae bacterium]
MKLRGSLRSLMTTVALTVALSVLAVPAFAAAPEIDFSAVELVFSGVSGKTTVPDQIMTIRNTGTSALTVSSITLTGTDAADYSLVSAPATPLNIAAGGSQAVTVRFAPRNTENGVQIASLRVLSNDADEATVNLGLYGLSAIGLEGGKEPSLNRVVTTLGYAINVGGTGLILGTSPNPIGDEVLMPLMQKASPGLVTLR